MNCFKNLTTYIYYLYVLVAFAIYSHYIVDSLGHCILQLKGILQLGIELLDERVHCPVYDYSSIRSNILIEKNRL